MIRIFALFYFFFFTFPAFAADPYLSAFQHADSGRWAEASYAARQTGNRLLMDYLFWRQMKEIDNRPSSAELFDFIERHPSWPDLNILMDRAEEALLLEGVSWEKANRWQNLHDKISERSRTIDRKDPVAYLIKHAWIHGEFNMAEQRQIRRAYPAQIGAEEVTRRVTALLWKDQVGKARDLISLLPHAQKKLAYARIDLQLSHRNVEGAISAVPSQLRNDPGLIYDRMRWRARKGLDSGVREMLQLAPQKVPYPEKWWNYRAMQVRDAINAKDFKTALRLLANHGQTSGATLADALWLRGWLTLRQHQNPGDAYKDFYALYEHVSYPVSLSRGAYWAAIAAKLNNNPDIATNWLKEAAKFPTTFYGQLALAELYPGRPLALPPTPKDPGKARLPEDQQQILSLIRLLARYDQKFSVEKFLQHLAAIQKKPEPLYEIARFVKTLNTPHLEVRIGKTALQTQHIWLGSISHPLVKTDALAIEPALALAISRQESEFNPKARSSANAIGLMQLLPGTARDTARRWGISYDVNRLTNPGYNMELGSYFLSGMLDKFGSPPLAIASYNAGPGNVSRWIAANGHPPSDVLGQLNWIESIPFAETRNYVQRVLENLQVYRAMLGTGKPLTPHSVLGQ